MFPFPATGPKFVIWPNFLPELLPSFSIFSRAKRTRTFEDILIFLRKLEQFLKIEVGIISQKKKN